MNSKSFQLTPFTPFPGSADAAISIHGKVTRLGESLAVDFCLHDPWGEIEIPAPASLPERRDNLWQKTCFEFFARKRGETPYWEINLSPEGHWNVFSFQEYRKEMKEQESISAMPFIVQRQENGLEVAVKLPLESIRLAGSTVELAVCAVLRTEDENTYWALAHPGPEPDFHHSDAFCITI